MVQPNIVVTSIDKKTSGQPMFLIKEPSHRWRKTRLGWLLSPTAVAGATTLTLALLPSFDVVRKDGLAVLASMPLCMLSFLKLFPSFANDVREAGIDTPLQKLRSCLPLQ